MAMQIGIIKTLDGTVTATATTGMIRDLQTGDQVYVDDLITTGLGGEVTIEFADGRVMDLGRDSQTLLDNAVFNPETAAMAESDADAIQAAILAGADPTQVTDATAAGAGTQVEGNEGHQPVVIDYLAPQVIPTSGFDTTGISVAFPEIEEEFQAPIAPIIDQPKVPEDIPIISISTGVEGGSAVEGDNVSFTVSQSVISDADTTVIIEVLSLPADSASEGADYEVIDTITVIIPAGSTVNTFNVATLIDALQEGNETFSARIVSVSNPSVAVDFGTALATGTIIDNYVSPIGGDTIHLTVDEGLIVDTDISNSLTFTAGTADLTSFKFDTDLSSLKLDTNQDGTADVIWNRVSDTKIEGLIDNSVAVTLTLTASTITAGATADVTVQAVLDDAFQHLAIPGNNILDLGGIKVIASTFAGDDVIGTAYMAVVDDIIEITSLTNANLANVVGAAATGDLVVDTGTDGLASLTFNGTVPLGLTTTSGHEISYQSLADGSLQAVDGNNNSVFVLARNDAGDGYTLTLDQLLQGPLVETTVSLTGAVVDAGSPVGSITEVSQNGVIIHISASDSSGADLINASTDGYGVDNGLIDEGDSEIVSIALDDPNGTFSNMSVTVGNFSTSGNSTDIYSYQLYDDGVAVGDVQHVDATATNSAENTTITINGSGFDEIQMWASHSGGNANSEGNYKIVSVDSDVTAISHEDVILNFGVDAIDSDGDFHGGDFQIAVDINGDASYMFLDDPSLDSLIDDGVEQLT